MAAINFGIFCGRIDTKKNPKQFSSNKYKEWNKDLATSTISVSKWVVSKE